MFQLNQGGIRLSQLIALDDGHGLQTSGKRTPPIPQLGRRVIRENEFNRGVVKFLDAELKRCGFRTLLVAPTDQDTPLEERTRKANGVGADLYVSCHYNAGGGEGLEIYHYPGSAKGRQVAQIFHRHLMASGVKRKDRGIKTANFHVLRETRMPAVLIEFGFMDDPGLEEAAQMIDPKVQKAFAVAVAKGICEYFGVKFVPEQPPKPRPMYRVTVDGQFIVDTAFPAIIKEKVEEAVLAGKKEIVIKIRD